MKTSTKTKTAIVIGELPSASNASNPLNLHSAAVVASVRGGLASGGINPFPNPFNPFIPDFSRFLDKDPLSPFPGGANPPFPGGWL
jgi:hypothetical protein